MTPPVASAELNLTYPIYAADFDPHKSDFLLVGGGGGEGRSGVGNKITLINTSKKREINEAVDIDLSRNEDSVTSLAVAQSTESSAVVFAGINSSLKDQEKGKNEHLRSFRLGLPAKRKREENGEDGATAEEKTDGLLKSEALGKAQLFRTPVSEKNETYQRVLRLSRPVDGSSSRMGAVATGLAPAGEVVIFDASKSTPTENDALKRIRLDNNEEASDVDMIPTDSGEFLVAYSTSYEISVCPVSLSGKAKSSDPRLLYQYPIPDVFKDIKRPSFRSMRFLTPRLIAAVINLPSRSGSEILLIDVPTNDALEGSIILRKRLHKGIKSATSFAVSTLPSAAPTQNIQHVLAIAGQDISITILTLDHHPDSNQKLSFAVHTKIKEVHPMQMTALALTHFKPLSNPKTALPQFLKLASTAMNGSIKVHTFPLQLYPTPPTPSNPARYVLRPPGQKTEAAKTVFSVFMAMLMIALGTLAMQAFLEIRGGTPEYLGAKNWLSPRVHGWLTRPYIFEDGRPEPWWDEYAAGVAEHGKAEYERIRHDARHAERREKKVLEGLKSTIDKARALGPREGREKAVVLRDKGGLSAEVGHRDDLVGEHRAWEELREHERLAWKERLKKAGGWVGDEAEAVFKGVFFGELAGVVGDAVRG
ncbi:MAG: hypothetical protein MMC23_006992 [Stictis urceolatum]|nr:hypothetical protein [Stictis urceolata]